MNKIRNAGLDPENLQIDLVQVVLDELGVPEDNSVLVNENHPDFVCRDLFTNRWFDICERGRIKDVEPYLDPVRRKKIR